MQAAQHRTVPLVPVSLNFLPSGNNFFTASLEALWLNHSSIQDVLNVTHSEIIHSNLHRVNVKSFTPFMLIVA
jgi:hypothetical protein